MKGKRNLFLMGVASCIGLLLFITPAYGANITIGGDYTDIGTIIFVSPKSGDSDTANGTALLNTLNGVTDNQVTNKYLIKLGPGKYNLGSTGLQMKQYVSIEGSGEEATTITAAISSSTGPVGAVMGADNAGLRFLTVENTGTGNATIAILNSSASPSIIHVTTTVSGGTERCGIFNTSSSPTMTNVTATASGGDSGSGGVCNVDNSSPTMTNVIATAKDGTQVNYGVFNNASSPTMTNVTATASGGIVSHGVHNESISPMTSPMTVKINHSVIRGTTATIYNGQNMTTRVGNSQLDGGAVVNLGTLTCAGVYDNNYSFYPSSCP